MQSLSVAQEPTLDPTSNRTASAAHHAVDTLADQALTGVGKVSGSLHVAVNRTADAVGNAADWAVHVPDKIAQKKAKLADSTFSAIKARPFVTLGGAIALGIVIGRLARRRA